MKKKEESFKYRTRRSFENIPSGNSLDPGRISESRQSPLLYPASYSERLLCGVERPIDRLD